mgnify:CR=1 FL=1
MEMEQDIVFLRWRTFCDQLESFLEYSSRQETYPNEACAHSIVERMEGVLETLRIIHNSVLLDLASNSGEDDEDIREYEGSGGKIILIQNILMQDLLRYLISVH